MITQIRQYLLQKPADYAAAKDQAALIDRLLGLETQNIEAELVKTYSKQEGFSSAPETRSVEQAWVGLPVQSMLTPYSEFIELINLLNPKANDLWVDLGAGYGRLGVVLAAFRPDVKFLGYEFVPARVFAGRAVIERLGIETSELLVQDLTDAKFKPPRAQMYFIYDFGSAPAIQKILNDLKAMAAQSPITVVARGRGVRAQIDRHEPWLSQVMPARHFDHYSIYSTGNSTG